MSKHAPYKQGLYKPVNAQKYVGNGIPTYRSSMELSLFRWMDKNNNVLKWSSESIIIPYVSPVDHKVHRYFVDCAIVIKEGENIRNYLVEVKPYRQTLKPTTHGNKKKSTLIYEQATYDINLAKWAAAREWCSKKGWEFLILTEKELPK